MLAVLLCLQCGCLGPSRRRPSLISAKYPRTARIRDTQKEATDCPDVPTAAQPGTPILADDPFWEGLRTSPRPSLGDLDYLGVNEIESRETGAFCVEPAILRLQDEETPSLDSTLADYADEALLALDDPEPEQSRSLLGRVAQDHVNYYSPDTGLVVGVGTLVAATFAHTSGDEEVYAQVHRSVYYGDGHDWAIPLHATKILGEGSLTLPVFAGAWLASVAFDEVPLIDVAGDWGERSLRAFLVGGPPLLAMQYLTGGSRPLETAHGSDWRPFQDTNGASGHAFMGALPLLTAAEMIDWWPGKIAFFVVSFFPGLSRVADDDHYVSQALLGWTMAYVAVASVDRTEHPDRHLSLFPLVTADQVGAAVEYRW